ncbi:hypothetical protein Hanom_Chr14g01317481 [Helianthus anomalus]
MSIKPDHHHCSTPSHHPAFRVTCTSSELEDLPENSKSPELEVSPEPEFHDGVSILFIFGIR